LVAKISFASTLRVDSASALIISMAHGNSEELKNEKENKGKNDNNSELDFQIQLVDSQGNEATLDVSQIKKLTPPLKVQYVKLKGVNQENYGDTWEPTLETFELPIHRFSRTSALLDIKQINFIFNRTERGVLILDEVSLNH
jgi:hypothetical protein